MVHYVENVLLLVLLTDLAVFIIPLIPDDIHVDIVQIDWPILAIPCFPWFTYDDFCRASRSIASVS